MFTHSLPPNHSLTHSLTHPRRLNRYFLRWADLRGAACEQCKGIALLFSRGVDSVKSGELPDVPPHLVPPSITPEQQGELKQARVWHRMVSMADEARARLKMRALLRAGTGAGGRTGRASATGGSPGNGGGAQAPAAAEEGDEGDVDVGVDAEAAKEQGVQDMVDLVLQLTASPYQQLKLLDA